MKEEPLVPIGIVATCAALWGAQKALRTGNAKRANRFFRYRIYAQSFTVIAMLVGGIYYGEARRREKKASEEALKEAARKRQQDWIKDLEAYDESFTSSKKP